jgi:Tol biopolymer transport system component
VAPVSTPPIESSPRRSHERLAWGAATFFFIAAAVVVALAVTGYRQQVPADPHVFRATLMVKTSAPASGFSAGTIGVSRIMGLSPDGQRLAFVAQAPNGSSLLWVRRLDGLTAQSLAGTDTADTPFWSPDNRFIAFFAGTSLKKVDVGGGPPITLCNFAGIHGGGTWNAAGVIVFSDGNALHKVSASGGTSSVVAAPDAGQTAGYLWPFFLPDGRHVLVRGGDNQTYIRSVDAGDEKLVGAGGNAQYANGHLVFFRGGALQAQPFDVSRLEVTGEATPIAEQVRGGPAGAAFSVAETGVLVYQTGAVLAQFTWFTRSGQPAGTVAAPGGFFTMALAPDGTRMVYNRLADDGIGTNLWITDLARSVTSRLTFGDYTDSDGTWSPDMSRIVYSSTRQDGKSLGKNLYELPAAGGVERLLLKSDGPQLAPDDWSPDGRFILYHPGSTELWALPLDGDRKPFLVVKSRSGRIDEPTFSPDGKWIAYNSDESGRFEVYLSPFPSTGARWQVSSGGGVQPTWRRDGRELYFLALDAEMMAVDARLGASPELGTPRALFRTKLSPAGTVDQYAPSPDGQRFIIMTPLSDADDPPTMLVGWPALVKPQAGK